MSVSTLPPAPDHDTIQLVHLHRILANQVHPTLPALCQPREERDRASARGRKRDRDSAHTNSLRQMRQHETLRSNFVCSGHGSGKSFERASLLMV